MVRKVLVVFLLAFMLPLASTAGILHHSKAQNPLANVDSKQPDKVLFDRSMEFMKRGKYENARLTLQTLINAYPDSEYIARAKLAIGDAWYNEGGTTGLAQAEVEYKDFETFFPNMPEAAEAQLKVANIHYRQMEKPDRDATHAKRAEEEYQELIQQWPDSKLVPQAKQRLREVQEVLAEKEFGIGKQYYSRESWPAAIARLETAVDTYPLYSKAPDALYMLAEIYEKEIQRWRDTPGNEGIKAKLITDATNKAAEVYSRIILNYPVTDRADDAKRRLQAMGHPIPTPSPEAVERDKAIENSRRGTGRFDVMMHNFHRAPDVKRASQVGEPTMTPPVETSAVKIVRDTTTLLTTSVEDSKISVEVRKGEPPKSQAAPRSDVQNQPAPETQAQAANTPSPQTTAPAPVTSAPASPDTGIPELKPMDPGNSQTPPNSSAPQAQSTGAVPANTASAQPADAPNSSQDQAGGTSSSRKGKKKK